MKLKAFFIIFEGLLLKQIIENFLEGESPTLIGQKLNTFFLHQVSQSRFVKNFFEKCGKIHKKTQAKMFSCKFWEIFQNRLLTQYLWTSATDQSITFYLPKCHCRHPLKHYVYKKLVMTEFYNDYNLPNLADDRTCCEIPQNEICIDHLQITYDQKVFQTRLHWSRSLNIP